jgi:hypothetical protein
MNPAAGLLLVGACRHYLWQHFPDELQGMASKGLGAAAVLCLLAVVWRMAPSKPLGLVLMWWAWEECQVLLCSIAYMVEPWHVEVGEGICSARIGFDIGAAGILFVAYLAHRVNLSDLTGSKSGK